MIASHHAQLEENYNTAYFLTSDQSSFSLGSVFMADGCIHI